MLSGHWCCADVWQEGRVGGEGASPPKGSVPAMPFMRLPSCQAAGQLRIPQVELCRSFLFGFNSCQSQLPAEKHQTNDHPQPAPGPSSLLGFLAHWEPCLGGGDLLLEGWIVLPSSACMGPETWTFCAWHKGLSRS